MAGAAAAVHLAPGLPAVAPMSDRLAPSLMGRGNPSRVALTFDDGPDPWSTPYFLTMLDDLGWRATFFVLGTMARQSPTLVARDGRGRSRAGGARRRALQLPDPGVGGDARRHRPRAPLRRRAHGNRPSLVPASLRHTHAGGAADRARQGLRTVLWTNWGKDWRAASTGDNVLRHVLARDVAGGTVLLHDSDCVSAPESWRATLAALPRLADVFASRNLTCGPLHDHGIEIGRRGV